MAISLIVASTCYVTTFCVSGAGWFIWLSRSFYVIWLVTLWVTALRELLRSKRNPLLFQPRINQAPSNYDARDGDMPPS